MITETSPFTFLDDDHRHDRRGGVAAHTIRLSRTLSNGQARYLEGVKDVDCVPVLWAGHTYDRWTGVAHA